MAKCKQCGKSGLFLRVDQRGHCPDCARALLYALYDICMIADGTVDYPIPRALQDAEVFALADQTASRLARECSHELRQCRASGSPDYYYTHFDNFQGRFDLLQRLFVTAPFLFNAEDMIVLDDFQHPHADRMERTAWENFYTSTARKLTELKTLRGKRNALQHFYDLAAQYNERLGRDIYPLVQRQCLDLSSIDPSLKEA